MNFESVRKIIVNLNDRDRVVNTREIPYDGKLSDEELVVLVKRVHEERVEGLQALMQISTKLEQKNEVESHHKLGLVFLRNGMGREALEELRRALALESDNASVLNDFGLASMLVENFSQAEETFRRAIELRPNYPDLHNNFGAALLQLARYPEALQEFETALGIHSGYAEAHFNLGLCLLTQSLGNGKMAEDVEGRMQTHLARAVELNASYDNQLQGGAELSGQGSVPRSSAGAQRVQDLGFRPDRERNLPRVLSPPEVRRRRRGPRGHRTVYRQARGIAAKESEFCGRA